VPEELVRSSSLLLLFVSFSFSFSLVLDEGALVVDDLGGLVMLGLGEDDVSSSSWRATRAGSLPARTARAAGTVERHKARDAKVAEKRMISASMTEKKDVKLGGRAEYYSLRGVMCVSGEEYVGVGDRMDDESTAEGEERIRFLQGRSRNDDVIEDVNKQSERRGSEWRCQFPS
jgi:hypothetical protein